MTQLRVGETHTPSEEGEGRADFLGLAIHAAGLRPLTTTAGHGGLHFLPPNFGPAPKGRSV